MGRHSMVALPLVAAILTSCGGTNAEIEGPRDPETASPTTTAAAPPTSPSAHREFSVSVSTDREVYTEGEIVRFTVEICNQGPATTTEGGGGSDIPFSFSILDEHGQVVADDTHAFRTMELRMVRWASGQCREGHTTWDQHYWNRTEDRPSQPPEVHGTPQRGGTVPAGEYRISVNASHGGVASAPFEIHRSG